MLSKPRAFSLIELSIVILIIGIIIAGVTQSSTLVAKMKLSSARTATKSSPVSSIKDLVFWIESTSENSFDDVETENNSPISTWYDINTQSSNKFNATQTVDNSKPIYLSKGMNGLPAVSFDGVDDNFDLGGVIPGFESYTAFIVEARSSATSGPMLSASFGATLGYDGTDTITIHHSNGGDDWAPYSIAAYNSPISRITSYSIFPTSSSEGTASVYMNGVLLGSNTRYLQGPNTAYKIGVGYTDKYYQGVISEMIIFNRALKNEERQAIEKYLSKKWGIILG